MLENLRIPNLALVDVVELEFSDGLTVLTGETGAGKSVIVNALSLALGGRGEKDFIRHGCSNASIEATFKTGNPKHRSISTVVQRDISRNGSSKAHINGQISTVTLLKESADKLAQILSQHASQQLTDESNHLYYLDQFGNLDNFRERVETLFDIWQKTEKELQSIQRKKSQLSDERELLLFQKNEIEHSQLRIGEEEELTVERKKLDSVRMLMSRAELIGQLLNGENGSITDLISALQNELNQMASADPTLMSHVEIVNSISFQLEDIRSTIEQYGSTLSDDPKRIEEINERLDEIYLLKKKYGGSEEAVLHSLEEINLRLRDRPDVDSLIEELSTRNEKEREEYQQNALLLSKKRNDLSKELQKSVEKELRELAIGDASFACELLYEDHDNGINLNNRTVLPSRHGLESARFLFSANRGEPLKSMAKTASGGEISRLLLALKSAELKRGQTDDILLVFDEVDAGIGGRTAVEVANKLKKLSESAQVLVITHLHQIARLADNHLFVEKKTVDGRTQIGVRQLSPTEILAELDRMIALPEPVLPK